MNNITLAICAYNCEKYIEETLSAVLLQTYQYFDLLIVNDCSTDNTVNVVEQFFEANPCQYEIINFEQNQGIGHARHFTERYAKTKYMLFVDADDLPYPTLVEKLYNKIESDSDLMAVGCYLEYIDSNGNKIGGGLFLGEKNKVEFVEKARNKKLIFMQPTAIYNREIALSVGGYMIDGFREDKPRFRDYCEDLDLWTRMSDLYVENKAIVVVPEVLCKYRKHEQGLSASSFNMNIRMRHIKTNLLRRRAGEQELTFIDFYNSLSEKEIDKLKRDAIVGDLLRKGIMMIKQRKLIAGGYFVMKSIVMNPRYFYQKVKKNSGIFR